MRLSHWMLALLITVPACGWFDRPSDTAVAFVNALNEGDTEAAMAHSDLQLGDGFNKSLEEIAFRVIAAGIDLTGGVQKVEVLEESVDDDRAQVELGITFKNREPKRIRLTLAKVDGDWKVRGVK